MCACNLSCKNAQHNRTRAYPGWQRLDLEHPAWHVDSKLMEKLNGNEITNLLPECWSVSVSVRGCMHCQLVMKINLNISLLEPELIFEACAFRKPLKW